MCLWPWLALNRARYGVAMMAPFRNYSHLLNLWNHGVLDANQTAATGRDAWWRFREQASGGNLNPNRTFDALAAPSSAPAPATAAAAASAPAPPPGAPAASYTVRSPEDWMKGETRARAVIEESLARHPLASLRPRLMALVVQLGLWTKFDAHKPNETEWAASGYRGRPIQETNAMLIPDQRDAYVADSVLADLLRRMQRSTASLKGNWHARWFDEYFGAWRLLRPIIGVLVLVGVTAALIRREWLVLGLGLIVLANALALSWFVAAAIDRYRVPFNGLAAIVAVYGVWALRQRRSARASPDASTSS
jgi:hypothetical protein